MPQKIAVEDFMRVSLVSDPQISPDEAHIACVRKTIDSEKSQYRSEIWLVPTKEGEPRRFVASGGSDTSPRWSPDGKHLAFLSDRHKPHNQIFTIPTDGGEATPLTRLESEGSLRSPRWSPDGSKIAFLYRQTPEAATKAATEERQKSELPPPPRHHRRLRYRMDGFGYYDDAYFQVWVADAKTGEAKPLTQWDSEVEGFCWSPDSTKIAFLADGRDDWDIAHPHTSLYTLEVATGTLQEVRAPLGSKTGLAWSPNGAQFAYVGNPDISDWWGTKNMCVFVLPVEGAETAQDLTGHTDQSVGYDTLADSHEVGASDILQWTADSGALFFPMSVRGDTRLYYTSANGGAVLPVSPLGKEMGDFDITPNGMAAITLSASTAPPEIWVVQESEGTLETSQRTHFNAEFLASVALATPQEVSVSNGEGGLLHGWILKPTDFDPAQKYPCVLYIHGGPHTQYGNAFFHELQLLAAEGYVVLYTNPRGSKGYGEAHTSAILGTWGEKDYHDLMAGMDYAVGLSFVDATRTAVMGGSYGGFMTAWMVGHTTRFTCGIADRLVGSLPSMAGTCDFPWPPDAYFKGNAWSNPETLWRHSPLAYAGNIVTPLLIVHSDGDLRCPAGQAEELFAALRLQRKTVEYVRYPAESSHGLSRNGPPSLRQHRLQTNLAWLARWLKA